MWRYVPGKLHILTVSLAYNIEWIRAESSVKLETIAAFYVPSFANGFFWVLAHA